MKAILEGTVAEFRMFFRTGVPEDLEQICMFCGCTDEEACPGGCSWVAQNVCSRCADIVHEALVQEVQEIERSIAEKKPAKNVRECRKTTLNIPGEVAPGKVAPDKVNLEDYLIPAFEHDRKMKSNYKSLFFTESDDGRVVLSYCGTKLYTTREKVLEMPNPIPHGYFGKLKSGTPSNRATAIRLYREYCGGAGTGEVIKIPAEPVAFKECDQFKGFGLPTYRRDKTKKTRKTVELEIPEDKPDIGNLSKIPELKEPEKPPEGEQKTPELKSPQLNVSDTPHKPDTPDTPNVSEAKPVFSVKERALVLYTAS